MLFKEFLKFKGVPKKAAGFWSTFRVLEQYRNLFDCVHDTANEMIKVFMELGYSNSELKQMFEVGGSRLRLKKELKGNMLLPDYIEEPWAE